MAYQALYRVWRPQTFNELVGQELVAETLKNAVKHHMLGHAYLFTGPRGTGKTSSARLLAKAINCENNQDGNPCNECASCLAITSGQSPDVIEIDAASNNGVEEIRDLREKVRYVPSQSKYKVYIIDEVHMLTTGAFNALLKTLEEPPAHVIFVLATTEPHKIPATVISRTQRFDFQKFQNSTIVRHLGTILTAKDLAYDPEALEIIARAANGGMRDALSLLDQALSYGSDQVDIHLALEVAGSFDHQVFFDYLMDIHHKDGFLALELVKQLLDQGKQAGRFVEELMIFIKDILLANYSKVNNTLLPSEKLQQLVEEISDSFYYTVIDHLSQAQQKMKFANQPDLFLEVLTLQLGQQQMTPAAIGSSSIKDTQIEDLEKELASLKEVVANLQGQIESQLANDSGHRQPANTPRRRVASAREDFKLERDNIFAVLDQATRAHLAQMKQEWLGILGQLSPKNRAKFSGTQVLAAGPNLVLISFATETYAAMVQEDRQLILELESISQPILGHLVYYQFVLDSQWAQVRTDYKRLRDQNGGEPLGYTVPSKDMAKIQAKDSVQIDLSPESEGTKDLADKNPPQPLVEDPREASQVDEVEDLASDQEVINQDINMESHIQPNSVLPDHVQKAIDLFGKDNITIH